MTDSNILLANQARLATKLRSRQDGGNTYLEHHQKVITDPTGPVPLVLERYLRDSDDSVELAIDGSSAAVNFDLAADSDEVLRITRVTFLMVLASAPEFDQFGDLAALTDGLLLQIRNSAGLVVDLLDEVPIKSNNDFAALGNLAFGTLENSWVVQADWIPPVPIRLEGSDGELLRVTVQDDLTDLTRLRVMCHGAQEDTLT